MKGEMRGFLGVLAKNKQKMREWLAGRNRRGIIINSGDTAALKRHRKIEGNK